LELETNGFVLFLEVHVERCEYVIRTSRKPMHTGLYSSWSLFLLCGIIKEILEIRFWNGPTQHPAFTELCTKISNVRKLCLYAMASHYLDHFVV